MTSSESTDRASAETAAGAVQGGGEQDATKGPRLGTPPGSGESTGEEDDFVVDHDADPPEETQPTTT